jgi:phenylalanyl-tRNA synthetase beta chain
LANPLSSEEPSYTTTLLPGLLKAAARNLSRGAGGVALFEAGTVAFPVDRGPAPTFSTFPAAKEDVALVVEESVPAAAVEAALREGAGGLLESIRLFDVYRGEQVGEGRKSLAFALRLRAPDRTLTEEDTTAAREAAVALAAERTGAAQRA